MPVVPPPPPPALQLTKELSDLLCPLYGAFTDCSGNGNYSFKLSLNVFLQCCSEFTSLVDIPVSSILEMCHKNRGF